MRKALIFVLVIVLMISYVGCETIDKNDTVSSEMNTLDTNKYIGLKDSCKKIKWNCEIKLDKIIDFSRYGNYFIDIDGNLYQYSKSGKLFSNNKNHKKISDKKIVRFLGNYIITYDNKIGIIFENQVEFEDFDRNGYSTNEVKGIQNLLDNNLNLVSFLYGYYPFAYVQNVEIYATRPFFTDLSPDILIGVLQSDEKFIGGYGNVIKTDKNYYYSDIVNQDELNKYADAEREYGFLRMEAVSDAYEEIQYYNGDKIIFKDDNEYIYYLR